VKLSKEREERESVFVCASGFFWRWEKRRLLFMQEYEKGLYERESEKRKLVEFTRHI
jgi:hypothetical protein